MIQYLLSAAVTLSLFSSTIAIMSPARFMACMLPVSSSMSAIAMQMPPEGNPGHQEPLPGQNCVRGGDSGHNCACHRKCVEGTNQEGEADPKVIVVQEDPKCRAYCYKSHCTCPVENCE